LIHFSISQRVQEKASFGMCFLVSCYERESIPHLSSAIIEDIKTMREAGSALIAWYYFDFKNASKRDVRGLLTSLLFQLGDDSDRCRDALHHLYTTCRNGSEKPSDAALAGCLKKMLELPGQLTDFHYRGCTGRVSEYIWNTIRP
jgi:hypothetical protein